MHTTNRWPGESRFLGWLYILPGLLIYLVFVIYPILDTLLLSFSKWDGFSKSRTWIGLENYQSIFADGKFVLALSHNLVFILFYSFLPILIGLLLAYLLGRRPIPGMTFFRTGLFLPQVLSMVVVGVTWRWVYNPVFGLINPTLRSIGLGRLAGEWLGDFSMALPSVGLVGTWVMYGYCMVLFLAGMQRISTEYYEAAEMDGANNFQQFWFIALPSLRPEIGVALITTIINALRVFDLVFVTTRGGPGDSTLVSSFLIYRSAFQQNNMGYAAAVSTLLTLVILVIAFSVLRFQKSVEE